MCVSQLWAFCHPRAMAGDRTAVKEPQIPLSEAGFLSDLERASSLQNLCSVRVALLGISLRCTQEIRRTEFLIPY